MKKQIYAILATCCILSCNLHSATNPDERKFQLKLSKQYGESAVSGELHVSSGFYSYDPINLYLGTEDRIFFHCGLVPIETNSSNKRLDYTRTYTFTMDPEIFTHGQISITGQEISLQDQIVEEFDSLQQAKQRDQNEYYKMVKSSTSSFFRSLNESYPKTNTVLNEENILGAFEILFPDWKIESVEDSVDLDRTVKITLNHDSKHDLFWMLTSLYEVRFIEREGKIHVTSIPEVVAKPTRRILYSELTKELNPNQSGDDNSE